MTDNAQNIPPGKFRLYFKPFISAVVITLVVAIAIYYALSVFFLKDAEEKVRNILFSQRALHHYIQKFMHPAFYKARDNNDVSQEYYAPEIFSSSFIVRNMHAFYNEEMKKAGLPEVYYKMASVNPRNPVNAADEFEASLIRLFNENRDVNEFRKVITVDGEKYLYYAIPFLETNSNCMRCHGKRENAPPGLQAIYSGQGGFNEKTGVYRAIESIRMPINNQVSNVLIMTCSLSAGTLSMLLLLFFNTRLKTAVSEKTTTLEAEIIERKQAEVALRKSEQKYRTILDSAMDGFWIVDERGRLLNVNEAYCIMSGYSAQELLAMSISDLEANETPDETFAHNQKIMQHGGDRFVAKHRRKDGSVFCLEVSAKFVPADGGLLVGFLRDITERQRAEEEKAKLENQLLQSQKMEAVGQLAGGVAHDFNNMLGVIIGHSELVLMKLEPSQPIYKNLIEIRSAAERSADLTRQLLAFARKQTIAPKVINLNEIIAGMLKMLERLIGENINLTLHTDANLWPLKVDPSQIDQLLANLCVNARDAIIDAGRITVETGNSSFDSNYCATHIYVEPGDYVRLAVSDSGCGMDRETQAHIFEPFFTTKGIGEGTGLGLATVYGIVKQNNGFIDVCSEPGHGTTFTIYLPRHIGDVKETLKEATNEPIPRGNETILLVEDEPSILNMATILLEGLGYTVLTAGTACEAIRIFKEQVGTISMLMTDVVMPDMNGRTLFNELLPLNPYLECLFMSGYTANVIAHHGVLEKGVHFIQKPFSLSVLATKVREVLDGK